MTGMGEDVYEAKGHNEDYGAPPGPVTEMLKCAGRATFDLREDDDADWGDVYIRHLHIEDARAVLESLGIPLEVLAALKADHVQIVGKCCECAHLLRGQEEEPCLACFDLAHKPHYRRAAAPTEES